MNISWQLEKKMEVSVFIVYIYFLVLQELGIQKVINNNTS